MKLGKTLKNTGNVLAKIVKKSIFSKVKLTSLLMKKRDLSYIIRSKCIFRQYSKFNAFSILATQLAGF